MNYKYELIRSKRKSISVTITSDNKIVVRCPANFTDARVEKFLTEKFGWINKIISANNAKLTKNSDILNYKSVYVKGVKLPLFIGLQNKITSAAVYVKDIKYLKRLFINEFSEKFLSYVNYLSGIIGVKAESIAFKGYKRRWGCCSSKNHIIFNYMIFMLPERLHKYIAVHELCHILHHNHSAGFWLAVKKVEPDYALLRKQLKGYDFLTSLY